MEDALRLDWSKAEVDPEVDALASQALKVDLARAADHAQLELDRQLKAIKARKEREERGWGPGV